MPETPGLGFSGLNDEIVAEFADPDAPEPFGPTDEWDQLTAHEERYRRIATQYIEISKAYSDKIEAEHALLRDAALRRDSKGTWAILQPHRRLNVRAVRKMFEQEA